MGGGEAYIVNGRESEAEENEDCVWTEPEGELVSLFTEANPNCRLTFRDDVAVLAFKNPKDVNQQWIKVDIGKGKGAFVDRTGQPGFILVHKATGIPLKHGYQVKDAVTKHRDMYRRQGLDGSIMWSLGKKDEGLGYRAMRPVSNVSLNMDVDFTGKDSGNVTDGCGLTLNRWNPIIKHLRWKFEPLHSTKGQEKLQL